MEKVVGSTLMILCHRFQQFRREFGTVYTCIVDSDGVITPSFLITELDI